MEIPVGASCCRPGEGLSEDVECLAGSRLAFCSVFGLDTQRRHDSHGSGEDLVVAGSVDYLITTPVQERQLGFRNRLKGGGALAIVAAGIKVKSECRVDEMQNESGRK